MPSTFVPVARLPLIQQAPSRVPIIRGLREGGGDVLCASCSQPLLENVSPGAIVDIAIKCAGCGATTEMPAAAAGAGLGGALIVVRRDHQSVGTFELTADQVVVGSPGVLRRAEESKRARSGGRLTLDVEGIETLANDARTVFGSILDDLRDSHPLVRLLTRLGAQVDELRAGSKEVDLYSIFKLHRATAGFRRWANDPATRRLMEESKNPTTFDHNSILLEVGSMFEELLLGPEFVTPGAGRTPDLVLRLSAAATIDLDVKTPLTLQRPERGSQISIDPSQARSTIRSALQQSRGQFRTAGILVIGGDFWIGGLDAYAESAAALLAEPIAADASAEARVHYNSLLGILLASAGYEQVGDGSFRQRLFLRWIRNPRYAGEIVVTFPHDMEGAYSIRIPGPDVQANRSIAEVEPTGNLVRFRLRADEVVEVAGWLANDNPDGQVLDATGRVVAFQLPEHFRPPVDVDFDVAGETGFTVVSITSSGKLLVDPNVGWIDLQGVHFRTE